MSGYLEIKSDSCPSCGHNRTGKHGWEIPCAWTYHLERLANGLTFRDLNNGKALLVGHILNNVRVKSITEGDSIYFSVRRIFEDQLKEIITVCAESPNAVVFVS